MLTLAIFYKYNFFHFLSSQKGVTTLEYAMIAVAIAILLTIVLGDQNSGLLGALNDAFKQIVATIKMIAVEY
ncbi:Flp family type IVb pilin [Serratia sp. NA_112.1]|uniref:Flp family type IVb pilin n=1 Tax=Serratia sp. NA_112.1 TaxID=3415665 RepID=UPI004046C3FB